MLQEAITKPYADFQFYQSEYKGTRITSEEIFAECEREAEAHLDMLTFRRISELKNTEDSLVNDIKFAVCSMADVLQNHKSSLQIAASGIQSENRDGYSVSYAQAGDSYNRYVSEMTREAHKYLFHTGLFYCGGGLYDLQREHNDS